MYEGTDVRGQDRMHERVYARVCRHLRGDAMVSSQRHASATPS